MRLFKKKRTVTGTLVCLYCPEVNSLWFTAENGDRFPVCTACNIHLVPSSFKQLFVSNEVPTDLELDQASALVASMSAMSILWAYLRSQDRKFVGSSPVNWSVWDPEVYDSWPFITQAKFLDTFRDVSSLSASEIGHLSDYSMNLAASSSNFLWQVIKSQGKTSVELWPKESLDVLTKENYLPLREYLEVARTLIETQPLWSLIDRLLELIEGYPLPEKRGLVGVRVTVHSFMGLTIHEASIGKGEVELSSKQLFETRPGSQVDPFGPDSPKRFYTKNESSLEILGPFDLSLKIVDSGRYKRHTYSEEEKLKLIHSYDFKLLVRADDPEEALSIIKQRLFEKFGFVVKRNGQNWLIDKNLGVDLFENTAESVHESRLFSKVIDVQLTNSEEWAGSAWQSRCA